MALALPGACRQNQQGDGGQRQDEGQHGLFEGAQPGRATAVGNQVDGVQRVVADEQHTFPAIDRIAVEEDWQAGDGYRDHYREIEGQGVGCHADGLWRDQRCQAEYAEQVEDITADDIAHSDIAFALEGSHDRGGQLR